MGINRDLNLQEFIPCRGILISVAFFSNDINALMDKQ